MDRITGVENLPDLVRIAINQSQLASVTQGDREHVLQVDLVHLLGRTLIDRNQKLPAVLHVLQRELGRNRRLDLNVARHQIDFILGQDVVVVDHAAFGAVGNDLFETLSTQLHRTAFGMGAVSQRLGPVRLEVLARGALAQHAVATSTALEVNQFALLHLRRCQLRCGLRGGLRPCTSKRQRQNCQRQGFANPAFVLHFPLSLNISGR